ncbi:MAG: BA14K family protein [Rhizobiaceae bacterium]
MKPLGAVIGGFVLSFGMFIAGMVFAIFVVMAEPGREPAPAVDVTDAWTSEPRGVNVAAQGFERVPAAAPTGKVAPAAEPEVDTMTTAALPETTEPAAVEPDAASNEAQSAEERAAARLYQAHAEWCSRQYRSYDAATNSYTPYEGGRRECMSPYAAQYAALSGGEVPETNQRFVPQDDGWTEVEDESFSMDREWSTGPVEYAVDETSGYLVVDDTHIQSCFDRYQSYRPEDNSYQPFGGGPRMQCE